MKQFFSILSFFAISVGLYFKFFYDIPDAQELINFYVSWFLIIAGISGLLITIFWRSPKKFRHNDND